MTREMLSDRIGSMVSNEPLLSPAIFHGFGASQISAILLFGARKEELEQMLENIMLADTSRQVLC